MMTKEQHIAYWVEASNRDWEAIQAMYNAKTFIYSLFFAHLSLEKLLKAHWVKDNTGNFPPKIHYLLYILVETKLEMTNTDKNFLEIMNQFQLEGRYPDYQFELYKKYDAEKTKNILDQVNTLRICLLKNL